MQEEEGRVWIIMQSVRHHQTARQLKIQRLNQIEVLL
jgi:hypothetical protein